MSNLLRRHFRLAEASVAGPKRELSPEEQAAWKEVKAAYLDANSPDHEEAVRIVTTGIYDPLFSPPAGPAPGPADPRVEAIKKSPAYLDSNDSGHARAVQAVAADYERRAAGRPPAEQTAEERMDEVKRGPAYLDADHPEHRQTVKAVAGAYDQKFSEGA